MSEAKTLLRQAMERMAKQTPDTDEYSRAAKMVGHRYELLTRTEQQEADRDPELLRIWAEMYRDHVRHYKALAERLRQTVAAAEQINRDLLDAMEAPA